MAKAFQRISENIFKLQEDPNMTTTSAPDNGGDEFQRLKEALDQTKRLMDRVVGETIQSRDGRKAMELSALIDKFALVLERSGY